MKLMKFNKPALYLRRDPDAGWTLAVWKWRIAFQVVGQQRPAARRTDAEIDELRRLYNSDAERHAMRVLLLYLSRGVPGGAK
jgi:hypothetical protein